jgi:hypothetical protein
MLQLLNTPFSRQFGPYRNFVSPKRLEILLKISAVSVLSLCLPVEAQEDGGCLAFRKTAVGLITQNNSQGYKFIIPLEPDDRLAAEAAIAKLFEHLARLAQFNRGADARSDCPVREHARDLVQPLRRCQGIRVPRNVVCCDLALRKPPFVCRVDRRDKAASGPENLSVAADCLSERSAGASVGGWPLQVRPG